MTVPERIAALSPGVALFDADGTLWHGDVSEDFTRWMIDRGEFDGDLWDSYERLNAIDPEAACYHILGHYRGHDAGTIATRVAEFWDAVPRPFITATVDTVRWLSDRDWRIVVCTGTPAPVMPPLKNHLPVDILLGLELDVDPGGEYTGLAAGIPSVGAVKVERVRSVISDPIALAVGNSALDVAMMRLAQKTAWAINPDGPLRRAAESSDWLISEIPR